MNDLRVNPFESRAVEYDRWYDKHPDLFRAELAGLRACLGEHSGTGLEIGVGTGRLGRRCQADTRHTNYYQNARFLSLPEITELLEKTGFQISCRQPLWFDDSPSSATPAPESSDFIVMGCVKGELTYMDRKFTGGVCA